MSANDVLTLVVAGAGVLVTVVALVINTIAGRRTARQAFAKAARRISAKALEYAAAPDGEKYERALVLELMTREADYLIEQCGRSYPEGGAVPIARAMEALRNGWWADRWWERGSRSPDPYLRCRTMGYWAAALWERGDHQAAESKLDEAIKGLTLNTVDAAIVRGDAYKIFGSFDEHRKKRWYADARREYKEGIPAHDPRRSWALDRLDDAAPPATTS